MEKALSQIAFFLGILGVIVMIPSIIRNGGASCMDSAFLVLYGFCIGDNIKSVVRWWP